MDTIIKSKTYDARRERFIKAKSIRLDKLNKSLDLNELSMGMSSDFLIAAKHFSTHIRVGSSVFGQRS